MTWLNLTLLFEKNKLQDLQSVGQACSHNDKNAAKNKLNQFKRVIDFADIDKYYK